MRIAILTAAAAYAYVLSEWTFFVTKPSVLSALQPRETLEVLLVAPLALLTVAMPVSLFLMSAGRGLRALGARGAGELLAVGAPAVLLAATAILLIENFTHTVLGFSVGSFTGFRRYLYAIGFAALLGWIAWTLSRWVRSRYWTRRLRPAAWTTGALIAISLLSLALSTVRTARHDSPSAGSPTAQLPNIVILAGDGIEARRMSALGFAERDTTPFIRSLLPESLVFENHFTNAANTTGAIGALLTGRLPTQTRVVYPPDLFRGADSYRHLPAMLRKLGYQSADISVRHYADAHDLNLRNGFHYANSRDLERPGTLASAFTVHPSSSLFLEVSYERVVGRLGHALGLSNLVNPYALVTQKDRGRGAPDRKRVAQLLKFIDRVQEPFFAHVHLLAPHGQHYHARRQVFSKGKRQTKPFMKDFYDDAILDYDVSVEEVVAHLRRTGKYERTLLVLNSDHGRGWAMHERLPLIVKLPRAEKTGRVKFNTQRVDIAPTLLDYVGVEIPEWMAGDSLLGDELDPLRPLIQAEAAKNPRPKGSWFVPQPAAPFYTLGAVGVVYCQWFYRINLKKALFWKGVVKEHTDPCPPGQQPEEAAARRFLVEHLRENAYDVSSLLAEPLTHLYPDGRR